MTALRPPTTPTLPVGTRDLLAAMEAAVTLATRAGLVLTSAMVAAQTNDSSAQGSRWVVRPGRCRCPSSGRSWSHNARTASCRPAVDTGRADVHPALRLCLPPDRMTRPKEEEAMEDKALELLEAELEVVEADAALAEATAELVLKRMERELVGLRQTMSAARKARMDAEAETAKVREERWAARRKPEPVAS